MSSDDKLLAATGIVFLIILIISLITYVLNGLILSKTAKVNGMEKMAYMGWVPFLNVYLMGYLGFKGDTEKKNKMAIIYICSLFLVGISAFIPFIGFLFALPEMVMTVYLYYRLFLLWSGNESKSIILTVISILTSHILFIIYGLMHAKKPFILIDEESQE